jgi:phage tail sheath protein FI
MGVVAESYHIVLATTKAAKKTAAILLESTVSIFHIRNPLYRCWGGRTLRWNRPASMPNVPAAI